MAKPQKETTKQGDELLKRMLKTPPKPKKKLEDWPQDAIEEEIGTSHRNPVKG